MIKCFHFCFTLAFKLNLCRYMTEMQAAFDALKTEAERARDAAASEAGAYTRPLFSST